MEKECSKIDEGYEESNSRARFLSRPSLPIIKKKIDTTGNVLETYNSSWNVVLYCSLWIQIEETYYRVKSAFIFQPLEMLKVVRRSAKLEAIFEKNWVLVLVNQLKYLRCVKAERAR